MNLVVGFKSYNIFSNTIHIKLWHILTELFDNLVTP